MSEAEQRALLGEVRKWQHLCGILRAAIMVGFRHCVYPRWVAYQEGDQIIWRHKRLNLTKSLQTPFAHELSSDNEAYWSRVQALQAIANRAKIETAPFDEQTPCETLREASLALSSIFSSLRVVIRHAQEYGICWSWLKSADGPSGTEQLTASELAEALVQPTVGKPTVAQLERRVQAAEWIKAARITYIGDLRQPANHTP